MLPRLTPRAEPRPPDATDRCALCFGHYWSGPRKGDRYPLCEGCREEARRLAGLADPRSFTGGHARA